MRYLRRYLNPSKTELQNWHEVTREEMIAGIKASYEDRAAHKVDDPYTGIINMPHAIYRKCPDELFNTLIEMDMSGGVL